MTRPSHNDRRRRGRRGFSLSEVVLALGVLAIGMTMAAALFPAAIKLNEQSTNDSLGTIIAENGLTVAKALVRMSNLDPDPNEMCVLGPAPADANAYLLRYPADPNDTLTTLGVVLLGRRLPSDPNGMAQLVIVSYNKRSVGNNATAWNVTLNSNPTTSPGGAVTVELSNLPPGGIPLDSPLIVAKNGSYAKIIEVNGNDCILDHMIDAEFGNEAWVIEESGVAKSPAMVVLVADAMLK